MDTLAPKEDRYRIISMLFLVVGISIVLMSVGGVAFKSLWEGVAGTKLPTFEELGKVELTRPQSLGMALQMIFTQVMIFGLPAVIGAVLLGHVKWFTGFPGRPKWVQLSLVPLVILFVLPIVNAIYIPESQINFGEGMQEVESALKEAETKTEASLEPVLKYLPFLSLIAIALFPAVCEELFFRGFLQQSLRSVMNVHVAVMVTAFIFSLVHGQIYGFFSRWLLGVALGYLVIYANSLWPAILAHFLYNGFQVVLFSMQLNGRIDAADLEKTESMSWWMVLLSVVLLGGVFWMYKRFWEPLPELPTRPRPAFDVYSHDGEDADQAPSASARGIDQPPTRRGEEEEE